MADQVPQPAPACGLRTVHRRADAGRAEPEQRLARVAVVARYEGDGRDSGKLAYEPGHRRELVAAAGVDREDERVHPLPPGRPQRGPEPARVDGATTSRASCPRSASAWPSHRSRFGDARTTTSWAGWPGATRGGRRS